MENVSCGEHHAPVGFLTGIHFNILTETDAEKLSVMEINSFNELTDPKLGIPNPSSECATCGELDAKNCEGHFGVIKLPFTVLNPYFVLEVVHILNKICPGCKTPRRASLKEKVQIKGCQRIICKYCAGAFRNFYPSMKFKVSSKDIFKKAAITVEVSENSLKRIQKKGFNGMLPADYWDCIPKDENHQHESSSKLHKRVVSPAQVYFFLKDLDRGILEKFARPDAIFFNSFLVMPNCHRVTEVHSFSEGKQLAFDERTRAYRKLVDFKGMANELGSRVFDCLKISRICTEGVLNSRQQSMSTGSKWIKNVILGKRTDNSFRTVVVGDPGIRLSQIGIPRHIAERLQIIEKINSWNCNMLTDCCFIRYLEKGEIYIRRNGTLVRGRFMEDFQIGDLIYRPLMDGDVVLINRPPSIHQHSLIALYVKILPVNSVVSINPLCCPPLCGDFDGDCLHGYVPQSLDSRAELVELVTLDKQLFNGQSGSNLLSFSQDSLTAAYLLTSDSLFFNMFEVQQLAMFCLRPLLPPAIVKAHAAHITGLWTGNQLFNMFLPCDFNHTFPLNCDIRNGDLLTPVNDSGLFRGTKSNLFISLLTHRCDAFLDFLHHSQEALCEWLSTRGLSVSLSDIYLSPDAESRGNMIHEVGCGLQEAQNSCRVQQFKCSLCPMMSDFEDGRDCGILPDTTSAVTHESLSTFRKVFRDIQTLVYCYSGRENSFLAMFKAGSKGNLLKLVQHSMCIGLQHSLVPLSFRFPSQLSCASWNHHHQKDIDYPVGIPFAVVENSYITGLNPLEFFVNSVSSRDGSFSDNADLPGVLNRRLMFFMRDIYVTYDGTVRNAYGDQLVQFSYGKPEAYAPPGESEGSEFLAGEPVGSKSACSISEAAYSALDHPVSALEASPLLNLKSVLECGFRKSSFHQTFSIFLSKKLGRWVHGYEYAALEIKNHLERLLFSDILSAVMIVYSPQTHNLNHVSPWVCHFHLSKKIVRRRRLKVRSIIDALHASNAVDIPSKFFLPKMLITFHPCSLSEGNDTFCITVAVIGDSKENTVIDLDTVKDVVIPVLLKTVIKGHPGVQRVDILWRDISCDSRTPSNSSGELYLKIFVGERCKGLKFWNILLDHCLNIIDMIDLDRSHPDDPLGVFLSYGIDAAWTAFIFRLNSALTDIGKTVLPQHIILLANCLSATGEFVGLNAKGLAEQREEMGVSSPFMQACFGSPGSTFIKAGKMGAVDELRGSLDLLSWGKISSLGIGPNFDILYSGKGFESDKPENIYNLLGGRVCSSEKGQNINVSNFPKKLVQTIYENSGSVMSGCRNFETISKYLKNVISFNDIQKLSHRLKVILHKYRVDDRLNEMDKATLLMALYFHPRRDQKIGTGARDIKVGYHSEHEKSRCFILVRVDGTTTDFSYHKCVLGALEMVAPSRVTGYRSRWLGYANSGPPLSQVN